MFPQHKPHLTSAVSAAKIGFDAGKRFREYGAKSLRIYFPILISSAANTSVASSTMPGRAPFGRAISASRPKREFPLWRQLCLSGAEWTAVLALSDLALNTTRHGRIASFVAQMGSPGIFVDQMRREALIDPKNLPSDRLVADAAPRPPRRA